MTNSFLRVTWLFALAVYCQSARAEESELRIGFILPLTGEWAHLGQGIRNGATLAAEDASVKPQLFFEDNRGELAPSAQLASRLIEEKRVDALVSIISGVAQVIRPIAARSNVLTIGICSDPTAADGRTAFINYLTAEQGVAKYLEYFRNTVGEGKSITVVSLNEAGFERIVDTLQAASGDLLRIRGVENFNQGTTDFRTLILRIAQQKPDALLLLGLSPEIELFARQARNLGVKIPLTSIEAFGLASDLSAFEGAWFVDSAVPTSSFRKRYEEVFRVPVTPGVGHAYDTVGLLIRAFQGTKSRDHALQAFRESSAYDGVIGRLSVRDSGVIWSDASVKTIRGGKPEPLDGPPSRE
jgi:branched-chain amino acid transport system substrate-binding protein